MRLSELCTRPRCTAFIDVRAKGTMEHIAADTLLPNRRAGSGRHYRACDPACMNTRLGEERAHAL